MNAAWLIFAGIVGGVLGGMGFGGGTLLLPILTFFFSVPYKLAAWVNLVVFLPTAVVALVVHSKNRTVEWRAVWQVLVSAVLGLVAGALLMGKVSERLLRRAFGVFLIFVGSISVFAVLFGFFKKNAKN